MSIRTPWLPAHCSCGCRKAEATADGCPCKECQPGPGIDYPALRAVRNGDIGRSLSPFSGMRARDRTRMNHLLEKDPLTKDEEAELDGLLNVYLHSN